MLWVCHYFLKSLSPLSPRRALQSQEADDTLFGIAFLISVCQGCRSLFSSVSHRLLAEIKHPPIPVLPSYYTFKKIYDSCRINLKIFLEKNSKHL